VNGESDEDVAHGLLDLLDEILDYLGDQALPGWRARAGLAPCAVEQDEDGIWCACAQLRPGAGAAGDGPTREEAIASLRTACEALTEVTGPAAREDELRADRQHVDLARLAAVRGTGARPGDDLDSGPDSAWGRLPSRGDATDRWLERWLRDLRDAGDAPGERLLTYLLEDYRLHGSAGAPLSAEDGPL
jgi:predicted RNase H-like HicB family nuclease